MSTDQISTGLARLRVAVVAAAAGLAVAAAVVFGAGVAPAFADDYPTWDDVKNAQANAEAKDQEVTRIQGLISEMNAQVSAAQQLATQRGSEYQKAQEAFDTANFVAAELEQQATDARAT